MLMVAKLGVLLYGLAREGVTENIKTEQRTVGIKGLYTKECNRSVFLTKYKTTIGHICRVCLLLSRNQNSSYMQLNE
jgi:hypothetical protein